MQISIFTLEEQREPKPKTASYKILQALKGAGHYGLTNVELSHITLSWHRRIGDLRADGYKIRTERLTKGMFRYYYEKN